MSVPKPNNETERLDALQRYRILDTAAEAAFDDFARLAAFISDTPIALITLVDTGRQWFKARYGLDSTETPRDHAFCSYTILGDEPLVVEDATADERFVHNPLVTSAPHIRFYAGAPLLTAEGYGLGSLCVIDRQPRQLAPGQRDALSALARQVVAHLELRRISTDLAGALTELKTLRGLLPICAHCKDVRNDAGYWHSIEDYLSAHTEADFSHAVCPKCFQQYYPKAYARSQERGE